MKAHDIAYIVLSFVLIATFISIFFFTYVSHVEETMVKDQINTVVGNFVNSSNLVLSESEKETIGNAILNNISVPDMSGDDRDAENTNKSLLKKSILIFSVMGGIGMVIVLILWRIYKFSLTTVLKYAFSMLVVIALTELIFVTLVIKNYVLIDQNYLYYLILNNLNAYSRS